MYVPFSYVMTGSKAPIAHGAVQSSTRSREIAPSAKAKLFPNHALPRTIPTSAWGSADTRRLLSLHSPPSGERYSKTKLSAAARLYELDSSSLSEWR